MNCIAYHISYYTLFLFVALKFQAPELVDENEGPSNSGDQKKIKGLEICAKLYFYVKSGQSVLVGNSSNSFDFNKMTKEVDASEKFFCRPDVIISQGQFQGTSSISAQSWCATRLDWTFEERILSSRSFSLYWKK